MFYLEWIEKGEDIVVIYYENLIAEQNSHSTSFSEGLENYLKVIIKFINFKWDAERFKCLFNDNEGKFHRKRTCINSSSLNLTPSSLNIDNGKPTINIFHKRHIIWIHSAINKVQLAMKERSIDSTHLSKYKYNHVKIVICP